MAQPLTVKHLAKHLTPSERAFVLNGAPDHLIAGGYALGHKGLAQLDNRSVPHRFYLTPTGRLVRTLLEQEAA